MKRACDICGREDHETWMDYYNTGSTRIWVCARCKKIGIREVNLSEAFKKRAKWKEETKQR